MRGQRHTLATPYPRERPGTHCTGGWVGTRAGLDRCGKSRPPLGFDPRTIQPRSQWLYWLSYPANFLLCSPVNIYPHFRDAALFGNTEDVDFIGTALGKRQLLQQLLLCLIQQPDSLTCHPPPQHTSLPLPPSPFFVGSLYLTLCLPPLIGFYTLFSFPYFLSLAFLITYQQSIWIYVWLPKCFTVNWFIVVKGKDKSKAIPLQAWTGPEGSRRLKLPDFKTVGTWRW